MRSPAADAAAHLPDATLLLRAHMQLGRCAYQSGLHEEAIASLSQALALAERDPTPDDQAHIHLVFGNAWEKGAITSKPSTTPDAPLSSFAASASRRRRPTRSARWAGTAPIWATT